MVSTPKVSAFIEPTSIDRRKRSRKGSKLSLTEKVQIVHQAVVQKLLHKDIAKEHRITAAYVTILQRQAIRNPKFIAELVSLRDAK